MAKKVFDHPQDFPINISKCKGRGMMAPPNIFTCNWTLFPVMGVIEAARFTGREKFAGMELECNPFDFWPTTISSSTIKELINIGKGEGICYTVHAPDNINPATDLPESRARDSEIFKRLVDLAVQLSSPVVGIHPGIVHKLLDLERRGVPFHTGHYNRQELTLEARKRAMDTYLEWGDLCSKAGLILTVENEVHAHHTVAPTAEILAEMIIETNQDNIRVNFDAGHAYIGAGLLKEFNVLKDFIVHIHLDDGRTPNISEHLPLGEGHADFSPLATFISHLEGAAVLEIYAPERPAQATLDSRMYLLNLLERIS